MRTRHLAADALLSLTRVVDPADRRASFRQAVAGLGQTVRVEGPPALDGVDPEQLQHAVGIALEAGLADELDWIAPSSAAVALYEMTISLPVCRQRRELGRRVFAAIYEGNAATFAAVASRMALGSGKPLDAATMRARIGLVLDLPVGSAVDTGALAYSLVARRELAEKWVLRPSAGALPERRLAAKLLEHAAREAVYRVQQGDNLPRDILAGELVRPVRRALLADREPLVWRHAAIARGLLASVDDALKNQIEECLDEKLTPTEWRRAAVSLVASLVGDPNGAMRSLHKLLKSEVVKRDPGLLASMVWGLPPVIEVEPDAAEDLLDRLSSSRRPDVAEAVAQLFSDTAVHTVGGRAAGILREVLAHSANEQSPALLGLTRRSLACLDQNVHDPPLLSDSLKAAMIAYESRGARAAFALAEATLVQASRAVQRIAKLDPHSADTIAELVEGLSDIDAAVLERARLYDLMLLGRPPGETGATVDAIERLYDELSGYLLDAEAAAVSAPWSRSGSEATTRRLRALLHLVDVDSSRSDTDAANARVRARLVQSVEVLLDRLVAGPDASVHRILCATLARSLDAAVREGVFEPADVLLIVADHLVDRQSVATLAEASTHPDVCSATDTYARFLDQHARPSPESVADTTDTGSTLLRAEEASSVARRVARLGRISAGGTHRAEALRQALLRLGRALELVAAARGMSDLVPDASRDAAPLAEIEGAADALRQLLETTRRRTLGRETQGSITVTTDVAPLSSLVERAASSGVPPNARQLSMATAELVADLPEPLAHATKVVLSRLAELPGQAPEDAGPILLGRRRAALPDWLLPRRVIGAFYVARALGSGGGSSVFLARRLEDRHEPDAEAFALKVPQYDPTTARSLSEQEFMQLFREEATALLALPQQENLARFVTFDLAARPRPILVMELIRGVSLERLIRSRSLTTRRAFENLDGILAGLSTMHAVGVGHLDVKPSNVILRDGDTPVLVDFGLSGRQLRPGCGTLEYCAPEVLGLVPDGHSPSPAAVDIYAIGALAFELLTGRQLFDADDETQLAAQHVAHDGWPAPLAALAEDPTLSEVAIVIAACLRRDPRQRASVDALRAKLRTVSRTLSNRSWPVDGHESFAQHRG
jgi:hypothetical protein